MGVSPTLTHTLCMPISPIEKMTYLSRRSVPTVDRISDLPDSILCHILSFIPTKLTATTRILSKRWKSVWLSVLALYFDQEDFKDFQSFRKFVFLTMFSLRDKNIPINSFTFIGGESSRLRQRDFDRIFKFLIQRGLENLNFDMSNKCHSIKLPPRILDFKTLHVLKLGNLLMGEFDKVDFPCVKTLVLYKVYFIYPEHVVKFLQGCPILEDLNTKEFVLKSSLVPLDTLNVLTNLVNVRIRYYSYIPMTLVCKAKSLRAKKLWKPFTMLEVPAFHNLTHMDLNIHDEYEKCIWLLGKLPSFPKLQHLIIKDCEYATNTCDCWKHPPSVPECLSSQLKTFCIRHYKGTKHEFEFAKYIMQHSKVLETMKIQSTCIEKEQMLLKLSFCTRASTTCKLLFD